MGAIPDTTAVILIDHGSRETAANEMLNEVVRQFKESSGLNIVEPAHMELAHPTLAEAFAACINQGASEIIIHPYFLAPGRHSTQDIPKIAAAAAEQFPPIPYRVTEPLGLDSRMTDVILRRIQEAISNSEEPQK